MSIPRTINFLFLDRPLLYRYFGIFKQYIKISCQPKLISLWNFTLRYLNIIQRNRHNFELKGWVFQELLIFLFLDRPLLHRYFSIFKQKATYPHIYGPHFFDAILRRNFALQYWDFHFNKQIPLTHYPNLLSPVTCTRTSVRLFYTDFANLFRFNLRFVSNWTNMHKSSNHCKINC